MRKRYAYHLEVKEEEINKIFEELEEAKQKIWDCYNKLDYAGVINLVTTEEDSPKDESEAYEKTTPYQMYLDFFERERLLDGTCRNEIVSGKFTRHLMEKSGLLKYAGVTGKTRIVIEYDNDTGEGWRRIVTEDATTVATLTNQ